MANRLEYQIAVGAKDEATKVLRDIDKQIKALTKQKAEVEVAADTDDAQKQIEDLNKQIKELHDQKSKIVVDAKVDQALAALDDVAGEAKKAEAAADALSAALGPELTAQADMGTIVNGFQRMNLSLDDIVANADKLGGKLRSVADETGSLDTVFRRGRGGFDDIVDGADQANSAVANMVGNASQDVGELVGVTGSAGVAIGQLAEYFTDSAFSAKAAGQGIGQIVKSFAAAAGPIAAISAATLLVSAVFESLGSDAEAAAKHTEEFGEVMASSADDALGFAQVLRDNFKDLSNYIADANDPLGKFGTTVDDVASKIPVVGGLFKEAGADIFDTAKRAGLSIYELGKALEAGGDGGVEFKKQLDAALASGKITGDEYRALTEVIKKYGDAVEGAARKTGLFNVDQKEANALLLELAKQRNPLKFFASDWQTLMDDMRDGSLDTQAATDALNRLANQLALDPSEVYSLALEEIGRQAEETTAKFEATADALEEWGKRTIEALEKVADTKQAQAAIDDLAASFNQLEISSESLSGIFDLGNAPLDTLGDITDIHDAIRDLGTFIKDEGVPNIFDPNDVDAGPFLDKIASLREPIQQEVTNAFATAGPEAAKATADAYVNQLYTALGGKLSKEQIRTLLNLDDMEVKIKVAVDATDKENAKRELDLLVGLIGESPYTASIALALQEGTISPQAAKLLVERELKGVNVAIPSTLATPDTGKAKAEADRWAARPENRVGFGSTVTNPSAGDVTNARNSGQNQANRLPPIEIPVVPKLVRNAFPPGFFNDAGGTVGPSGGIVAEKRPEIINRRFLAVSPTVVPPGTRVTSGARTARILRTRGTRGLREYDRGGVVAGSPTINVNIRTGAIANSYEMIRLVRRTGQLGERLFGKRG